ncbi:MULTISPECIES: thioredoxin family protein [Aminobacterium]|jgi:thioredoxin 1|uniref:thioredoxin family protein n=1 Tax=Aminobacterium TaxID=81466 RepID=UPI00257CE130|nr:MULTISPECIES: thioredoxin family protein [unclassified Aminobacterium]
MDKKKLLKIIIPISLVLIVAGIWIFKNVYKESDSIVSLSENKCLENLVKPKNEEDFVLEATSIDLDVLKEYNLPIIIDFGANSCIPCKKMAPVLKTLNAEMQGKAIIKFVDVWKNGAVANDFPIQVIPTQVFINADGTPYVPSGDMQIKFDMYRRKDIYEHAFTVHQGELTEDQMRAILADMGVDE